MASRTCVAWHRTLLRLAPQGRARRVTCSTGPPSPQMMKIVQKLEKRQDSCACGPRATARARPPRAHVSIPYCSRSLAHSLAVVAVAIARRGARARRSVPGGGRLEGAAALRLPADHQVADGPRHGQGRSSNGYRASRSAPRTSASFEELYDDNVDGSEFYNLADSFSRRFEELYAKVAGGDGGDGAGDGAAPRRPGRQRARADARGRRASRTTSTRSSRRSSASSCRSSRCAARRRSTSSRPRTRSRSARRDRAAHVPRGERRRGGRGTRRRARAPGAHPGPRVSAFARAQIDRFVTSCLPANKQSKKKKMAGGDESKAKKQKQ